MSQGEVRRAADAAERLRERLHGSGEDVAVLDALRGAYRSLLNRRGYFVETPDEFRRSVEEIREVGPGFDLFDLSEALAACDAASDCNGTPGPRRLPELLPFYDPCRGGGRNAKGDAP